MSEVKNKKRDTYTVFQKGDKVRCIDCINVEGLVYGAVYTVVRFSPHTSILQLEELSGWFHTPRFELVKSPEPEAAPPFRPGETVYCIETCPYGPHPPQAGNPYEIEETRFSDTPGVSLHLKFVGIDGWYKSKYFEYRGAYKPPAVPEKSPETTTPTPSSDDVYRPHHYARYKVEPIYFIMENNLPFWLGNMIKYGLRYDAKDGLKDLKKARRYLDMQIKKMEGDGRYSE